MTRRYVQTGDAAAAGILGVFAFVGCVWPLVLISGVVLGIAALFKYVFGG